MGLAKRGWARAGLAAGLLAAGLGAWAGEAKLPPELEGWRGWVEESNPSRACPSMEDCAWTGLMEIVRDGGAGGKASWTAANFSSKKMLARVPGDARRWPSEVRVNGKAVPIAAVGGFPFVEIAGNSSSKIEAAYGAFGAEPLPLDPKVAFVRLGGALAFPGPEGLAVGGEETPEAAEASAETPKVSIRLNRLLVDGTRPELATRLLIENSGAPSSVALKDLLPEGAEPFAFEGAGGRWEKGELKLSVPPGVSTATIWARLGPDLAGLKSREPKAVGGEVEGKETWSIAAAPRLRSLEMEGDGVDPKAAGIPEQWRGYPSYSAPLGGRPKFAEKPRQDGAPATKTEKRSLNLRFDLSGNGYGLTQTEVLTARSPGVLTVAPEAGVTATHAKDGNEDPLPVLEAGAGRAVPHGAGRGTVKVYARSESLPLALTIPSAPAAGGDLSEGVVVSIEAQGGWKILGSEGLSKPIGIVEALDMWDWFVLILTVWGSWKFGGAPLAAATAFAMPAGRLFYGAPFGAVAGALALCWLATALGQGKAGAAARKAAGAMGLILGLALARFTVERTLALIHSSADRLGQPGAGRWSDAGHSTLAAVAGSVSGVLSLILFALGIAFFVAAWKAFKKGGNGAAAGWTFAGVLALALPSLLTVGSDSAGLDAGPRMTGNRVYEEAREADGVFDTPASPAPAMKSAVSSLAGSNEKAALAAERRAEAKKRAAMATGVAPAGVGEPSWSWTRFDFEIKPGAREARLWLAPPWASKILGFLVALSLWGALASMLSKCFGAGGRVAGKEKEEGESR